VARIVDTIGVQSRLRNSDELRRGNHHARETRAATRETKFRVPAGAGGKQAIAEGLRDVVGRYVSHLHRVIDITLSGSKDPVDGHTRQLHLCRRRPEPPERCSPLTLIQPRLFEKGDPAIWPTHWGKGSKIIVVADRAGLPFAVLVAADSPAEV